MKKFSLLLSILLVIFLVSCEPDKYYFKDNTRNDEVVSIELISYTANDIEIVDSIAEMLDFYTGNMTILETLSQSEVEDFMSEFSYIEFLQGYPHLSTPDGTGVKINYENGDFLIVTNNPDGKEPHGGEAILYNSDGQFMDYYGSISWMQNFIDLVNEYYQTQIE